MRELGIQKVMKIRLYDITTGEMMATLKRLQESTFTNGQETVFLTNGDGSYAASFDHSKMASISGANSRISGDLVSLQVGGDIESLTTTTVISHEEVLTVTGNSATTTFTATGTADAEIKFAYVLDENGNRTEVKLTQAAVVGANAFTYDTATKKITTTALVDGDKISVTYNPTASKAERISNLTTNVSATVRVVADCLFKDVCNDQLVYGQIQAEKGHIEGAFEWSLSEGGNPSMHNFKVDFLETCDENKLWDLIIYDKADLT